jgi:hypothetical protein
MDSSSVLLYVEYFKPAPDTYWPQMNRSCSSVTDENIDMIHALNSNGTRKGNQSEKGFGTLLLIMTIAFDVNLLILSPYDV